MLVSCTGFVNQMEDNFYVCCDLLYLYYSEYRLSIFYFSYFPAFEISTTVLLTQLNVCTHHFPFSLVFLIFWGVAFHYCEPISVLPLFFLHCLCPCSICLFAGPTDLRLQEWSRAGERLLLAISFSSLSLFFTNC